MQLVGYMPLFFQYSEPVKTLLPEKMTRKLGLNMQDDHQLETEKSCASFWGKTRGSFMQCFHSYGPSYTSYKY